MENEQHPKQLTAAEISQIWAGYQNDAMLKCVLEYFVEKAQDPEITRILEYGLQLTRSHIDKLTAIFNQENYPVPVGFTEDDVNTSAPRLFSDSYILYYIHQAGKLGMNAMSVAVALSARPDVYDYFAKGLTEYLELHKKATETLLSKGLFIRAPHLPTPRDVDFVDKYKFLSGFGEPRPLVSLEVTNLFENMQRNVLGAATLMGFSQVAKSKKVARFMVKGKDIAEKHVEIFGSQLRKEDLNAAVAWNMDVTDSTVSPFSDKLMMFHTTALIAIGLGYYGSSIATSLRSDLVSDYSRLSAEIMKYSLEGAKLMIENGWLEEPPQAANRDKLVKEGK